MPYTFSVIIRENNPPELQKKAKNAIVRKVLQETGTVWAKEFLPKHFGRSSRPRYNYVARRPKYNAAKRRAKKIKVKGGFVKAPQPPEPFQWSGAWKESVLSKAPSDFKTVATSTSKKQKVRIKVPIPHALQPRNAGEFRRVLTSEIKVMQKFAINRFAEEMKSVTGVKITRIGAK